MTGTRKNNKKILNNSYKNGDNLKGDEYEFANSLNVDDVGLSVFMKDSCDNDSIQYSRIIDAIYELTQSDKRLIEITEDADKKYSKEELNEVFEIVYKHFHENRDLLVIMRMSYMFDIIANVTSTKHANLFDALTFENRSLVIVDFSAESKNDLTETIRYIY